MYNFLREVLMKKLDIKKIDSLHYYENNDLGYELKGKQNVFKVWSPIADEMYLCMMGMMI